MFLRTIFLLVLLFQCLWAELAPATRVLYSREVQPAGWTRGARANPSQEHTFTVALPQKNLDVLERKFFAVSDPDNEEYGKFMTIDEILDIIAPSAVVPQTVISWLKSATREPLDIKNYRDALSVTTTIRGVEEIFNTTMYVWSHEDGSKVNRVSGATFLPLYLEQVVVMVTGLMELIPPRRLKVSTADVPAAGDAYVSLISLRRLYNIPDGTTIQAGSSQCVTEFQDQPAISESDYNKFYQENGVPNQPKPTIVGPFPSGVGIESTLDYQYVTGIGLNGSNWYWTEANWLYDFVTSFFNRPVVPFVNSISYGWSEAAQCQIDNPNCNSLGVDSTGYVTRVNTEFQKIGLRGVTITVSSGDSGCHGRTDEYCTASQARPDYPGSSPYITSVGATQIYPVTKTITDAPPVCAQYACEVSGTEAAVSVQVSYFTSGGGFSNVAPLQDYQKDAVNAYFKSGVQLPPATFYNASGRGYPDVSASGHNYVIVANGNNEIVGGTSASSPAFAGMVALLNDYRLQNKLQPLGFLNPLLYKMYAAHPQAFQDITQGDNKCTEAGCQAGCKGYLAYKGWDPVTGLGTPNWQEMLNYIKTLDAKIAARRQN